MIHWPAANRLTKIADGILERFKKTSVAKELEQDGREWRVVSWSWMPDPPYTVTFRSPDGDERYCIMEADGRWQVRAFRTAAATAD